MQIYWYAAISSANYGKTKNITFSKFCYVMEIVSKFIFNVENFFHHKIHMVKVKFKTKGQRSFPPNVHIH